MALMEISVVPLGTGSTSFSAYVADMVKRLKASGLSFTLTDMGTIVEGEIEDLLRLAQELHELPFGAGAQRVYTVIKIDDRRDKKVSLGDKTRSVEMRLNVM